MYYITVEFYDGGIFKYLTATEREAKFFKTMTINCDYAVKQVNIINLFEKKENTENDNR